METLGDLYSLVGGIIVFGLAVPLGYFVCSRFAHREMLSFFFSRATEMETARRDRLFLPLTRRMSAVSPNAVTLVGFLIVGALAGLFWINAPIVVIFFAVFLGGVTDMLDGPLARNNNRVTTLGAKLDWMRDLSLTLITGIIVVSYGIVKLEFFIWFLTSWGFLGLLRMAEFKMANGTFLNTEEDYKFILDRVRLILIWVAALLLILASYHPLFGAIGTALTIAAIAAAWFSVLLHAAHLKILRQEANAHQ